MKVEETGSLTDWIATGRTTSGDTLEFKVCRLRGLLFKPNRYNVSKKRS